MAKYELTGTASNSVHNNLEIERKKDQLKKLTRIVKDQKVNAAYNPNEPRKKTTQVFVNGLLFKSHYQFFLNTEIIKIRKENKLNIERNFRKL